MENENKKCQNCRWYTSCYNSNQRYNEEVYNEKETKICDDYQE